MKKLSLFYNDPFFTLVNIQLIKKEKYELNRIKLNRNNYTSIQIFIINNISYFFY